MVSFHKLIIWLKMLQSILIRPPSVPTKPFVLRFRIFNYRYAGHIDTPKLKDWQVLFHHYEYDRQGYIRGLFVIHNQATISWAHSTFLDSDPAFEVWGQSTDGSLSYMELYNEFCQLDVGDRWCSDGDLLFTEEETKGLFDWNIVNEDLLFLDYFL